MTQTGPEIQPAGPWTFTPAGEEKLVRALEEALRKPMMIRDRKELFSRRVRLRLWRDRLVNKAGIWLAGRGRHRAAARLWGIRF